MNDVEKNIALRDAAEVDAEDAFFKARPGLDCPLQRTLFDHGFVRGWDSQQIKINMLLNLNSKLGGVEK